MYAPQMWLRLKVARGFLTRSSQGLPDIDWKTSGPRFRIANHRDPRSFGYRGLSSGRIQEDQSTALGLLAALFRDGDRRPLEFAALVRNSGISLKS